MTLGPARRSVTMPTFLSLSRWRERVGRLVDGEDAEVVDAAVAAAEGVQHQDAGGVGEGLQDVGAGFGLDGIHIHTHIHNV